jgi:hypothetical protein
LLETEDYLAIGKIVRQTCERIKCGFFAVLEGGCNHQVLGYNVMAFFERYGRKVVPYRFSRCKTYAFGFGLAGDGLERYFGIWDQIMAKNPNS